MSNEIKAQVVVLGAGPAGYSAAFRAADLGLDTTIVERFSTLGGVCLNRGCIPAKAFLETASVYRHVAHAADFGIESSAPVVNFATTQARKKKIVDGLVKGLTGLVKAKKVTYVLGVGALNADNSVTVTAADGTKTELAGKNVVLAAGSVPRVIPGFEPGGPVMTSDEVLMLDRIPARIAVIGGGAIGCEFASAFADLGADVTILEGLPKILPGLDADLANVVVRSFGKKKIAIKTGVAVTGHTPTGNGSTVVSFGEGEKLEVDAVIVSVGRRPFTDQLGLANTKVAVSDRGFVEVDAYCRTNVANVYAVGDLINTPLLAHVAYAEAILVVKQILGETATQAGSENSPGRFRFDFPSTGAVPDSVLNEVESRVNTLLLDNLAVTAETMSQDAAKKIGAMALFGEKYGDQVRVVSVGDWARELCGGTHVSASGQLGVIKLLSESSVGAGVRRVEALVGVDAYKYLAREHLLLNSLTEIIKGARAEELPERISDLLTKIKEIEKELATVRSAQAMSQIGALAGQALAVNDLSVIATALSDGIAADDLRKIALDLKSKSSNSVVVLVSVVEGKAVLVAAVSDDAKSAGVKAGALVKIGSTILGGGGGGKDDFAQGGGTNLDQISVALSAITDAISGK